MMQIFVMYVLAVHYQNGYDHFCLEERPIVVVCKIFTEQKNEFEVI